MGSSSLLHPVHPALAHFPVAFWLGSAMVLVGGFCGGTLVYGYGVGVSWHAEKRE
jgi:uncharacterized membrane protein